MKKPKASNIGLKGNNFETNQHNRTIKFIKMKIFKWVSPDGKKNFGDELNSYLWPKLIPEVFNDSTESQLVGIGTILNAALPKMKHTIIFGAGTGYGSLPPWYKNWKIYCLRGPYSAFVLKVDPRLAITDPAVLVRKLKTKNNTSANTRFGYMPHWRNASQELEACCAKLNIRYVDPLEEVPTVLGQIGSVDCLITEALHGAIVADSFRIPWIPVTDADNPDTFPFKWQDWCSTVKMVYKPGRSPMSYTWLNAPTSPSTAPNNSERMDLLYKQIAQICASGTPLLSNDSVVDRLCERYEEKIAMLRQDFHSGQFS